MRGEPSTPFDETTGHQDDWPDRCPACGAGRGLIRVDHHLTSGGTTYDRFFCASCGCSTEVRRNRPSDRVRASYPSAPSGR